MYERIIVVTRESRLQELVRRFNTVGQAKFYIEHSGADFAEYEQEDSAYRSALKSLQKCLDVGLKIQFVDRSFLPNFLFSKSDIVIALGQDGIVANTAKYVGEQPVIGVNPDASMYDGVLVTNRVAQVPACVAMLLKANARIKKVTLAEAQFSDGQRLLAFNDLFVGVQSHVSARYRVQYGERSENQSSSGIIISTGAGSTGWLSSAFNMASAINQLQGRSKIEHRKMDWASRELLFVVREPFVSKQSAATIAAGLLTDDTRLTVESHIPFGGTIFSDGVEADFIRFNSGSTATIGTAKQQATLVLAPG